MKYLIVGLGNDDPAYVTTKHNIGFWVVDQLAAKQGGKFSKDRLAWISTVQYKGRTLILMKPTIFMNNSGKSVQYWLLKCKIAIENILVITDDVSLPLGKLRMRKKGSCAGHNGLRSIETVLHTTCYPRLKFGIGNQFFPNKLADYVLSPFEKEVYSMLPLYLDKACNMVLSFCTIGIYHTMNSYN